MKKIFKLTDLDCAHCAAKIEEGIRKLDGVQSVQVNFLAEKLILEAEDEQFDRIVGEAVRICRKVEPDCELHV